MAAVEHEIKRGDTLSELARKHGFKYWRNIWYADENYALAKLRNDNPEGLQPKDKLYIPDPKLGYFPTLEKLPGVKYTDVPLFTQSQDTCWLAAAKMMYMRKHTGKTAEKDFVTLSGSYYTAGRGLKASETSSYYCSKLGMKRAELSGETHAHYMLATKGPLLVTKGDSSFLHAMVMTGYDLVRGKWYFLDPATGESYDFGESDTDDVKVSFAANPSLTQMTRTYKMGAATILAEVFHY